jgi:uncharacterized protein (TIGR03437 family)
MQPRLIWGDFGALKLALVLSLLATAAFGQDTGPIHCQVTPFPGHAVFPHDRWGHIREITDYSQKVEVLNSLNQVLVTYVLLPTPHVSPDGSYNVYLEHGPMGAYLTSAGPETTLDDFLDEIGCPVTSAGPPPPTLLRQPGRAVGAAAAQATSPPAAGEAAQAVALGFFNSDNLLDNAAVTYQVGITVNLANADGTVLSSATYPLPSAGTAILAADFNGDGNVDLAVIQNPDASGQGSVAILLGHGDGTFGAAKSFPAGAGYPSSIAMGDFNGDGKLDLAVGNSPTTGLNGTVAILLGKGDGTFGAPKTYNVTQLPSSMVVADFNADGKLDLAVLNVAEGSDQVQVFLGNGDGTFRPGTATSTGTGDGFLSYTDLNHDGKMDLVIADQASSTYAVLFGNGDGTFQNPQFYLAAAGASSISLLPFQDGNTAILVPDNIIGGMFYSIVDSSGIPSAAPLQFLGTQPAGIAAADLNGDQQADLVVTDAGTGNVYVMLNSGGGQFGSPASYPVGSMPGAVAIADLNNDGKLDVVAADSGGIDVLLGNGSGTFNPDQTYPANGQLSSITLADFNSDGNLDVASANSTNGGVVLFAGNGDGTFQTASTIPLPNNVVPLTVVSGDFNGDGKPDLAVVYNPQQPSSGASSTTPGGICILLGSGDGSFSTPVNIALPGPVGPSGGFNAADVNGDGKLDLVVAYQGTMGNQVVALLGNGDGTFKMAATTATLTAAATIVITDLNGDGKPDLVLGDCCGLSEASYMIGNGDGTFQPEVQIPSGPSPGAIVAANLSGSGGPDLAIAGYTTRFAMHGTLTVLLNGFSTTKVATIVSAANPAAAAIAPGSLATAYGTDLANSKAGGASLPLPTTFGGTFISILDSAGTVAPAPLLYVIPTQVNFEVPAGLATGAAQLIVNSGDGTQSIANVQIAPVAPGLFELNSAGLAAAYVILYHSDGSQTVEQVYKVSGGAVVATPVSLGSSTDQAYLFLFGTGIQAAGTSAVTVTVGGTSVPVKYAGTQGSFAGLDQANVVLPHSLAGSGNVTVQLTAQGIAANPVQITIQ